MTPRDLAQKYAEVEERVSAIAVDRALVAAETFCEDREVRRFFRRLGLLPRATKGASASEAMLGVISTISQATGTDEDRARAVLAAYCRTDGELAKGVCGEKPRCAECPLAQACPFFGRRPSIKNLPETERPRERLLQLGQEQLTDAELLAILIGGGTREQSAVDLARTLLVRFGGFRELSDRSMAELQQVRGIGLARSAAVKAALEIARRYGRGAPARGDALLRPEAVFERYRTTLGAEKKETFVALLLDAKNRLIREERISTGSRTQSIVHPREVFEPAIRHSAVSVIFVHNHPSGDATPSAEDVEITRRLRETGDVIGIRVLDHVVLSETGYSSLAQKGMM